MNQKSICKHLLTFYVSFLTCTLSWGQDAIETLDKFLKNTQMGRAQFTQTSAIQFKKPENDSAKGITATTGNGASGAVKFKKSTGIFEFYRPNQFKFEYSKPFEQMIVADGKTIWIYDVALNQVTRKNQTQALQTTPVALIMTAQSKTVLEKSFELKVLDKKSAQSDALPLTEQISQEDWQSLQWIQLTPRGNGASFKTLVIGLKEGQRTSLQQPQLMVLLIEDKIQQKTLMQFTNHSHYLKGEEQNFSFTPPKGTTISDIN